MIKQIATVAIYVEDQQQAKRFWTEQVGFTVTTEHPMGPNAMWLEVAPAGGGSRLVLYPKSMMKGWEEQKASIVFECDDIMSTYATMKANGVEFNGEPNEMQWGTYASFSDPDGNQFLLKG
ncbi:VOC family protein [Paenibacillus thiaminolyticus]|uniref:VOC family protein n=1 Tax=Paenibacillus thiaminolyticus TaxID=49283 RepID=A0A3A3GF23_PANTH|nr:VOC family protein [Paenibacillus thiaminolyticus]RJG22630.1 VOC family protein [Paenibacillus thiaminolyticus]